MEEKKKINYYKSFYDVSKQLNKTQFYEFNTAIYDVLFYEKHIDSIQFNDSMLELLWTSIKHSLQSSIYGYCGKQNIEYDGLFKGVSKGVSKGVTNNDKDKEKDNKESTYDIFIKYLKEHCPIKTKVTKTKEGKKMVDKLDSEKLREISKIIYNIKSKKEIMLRE